VKITTHLFTITEVPGVKSIVIEPSDFATDGVHVLVTFLDVESLDMGLDDLRELTESLGRAEQIAHDMALNNNTVGLNR